MKRTWTWRWALAGALAAAGTTGVQAANADTLTPPEHTPADSTE